MAAFRLFTVVLIAANVSCASRPDLPPGVPSVSIERQPCLSTSAPVTWTTSVADAQRERLDLWCRSVGPPVLNGATVTTQPADEIIVVSWNVHGGAGRVDDVVARLRADARAGATGIVLLLQEVVRRGTDVPAHPWPGSRAPRALRSGGAGSDIVSTAERLGLALAYVPSMRDGVGGDGVVAADRGNAILSSVPITDVGAIELPLGHQRRVAVAATLLLDSGRMVRVVSFHLDTRRSRVPQATFLAAHLRREVARGLPVIAGGDVNALFGTRDAAHTTLATALPPADCGDMRTNTWPWRLDTLLGWWRGRVDFIFANVGASSASAECLTEPDAFGSDHLPIVMKLPLKARS